jgi:hypothetical protein
MRRIRVGLTLALACLGLVLTGLEISGQGDGGSAGRVPPQKQPQINYPITISYPQH